MTSGARIKRWGSALLVGVLLCAIFGAGAWLFRSSQYSMTNNALKYDLVKLGIYVDEAIRKQATNTGTVVNLESSVTTAGEAIIVGESQVLTFAPVENYTTTYSLKVNDTGSNYTLNSRSIRGQTVVEWVYDSQTKQVTQPVVAKGGITLPDLSGFWRIAQVVIIVAGALSGMLLLIFSVRWMIKWSISYKQQMINDLNCWQVQLDEFQHVVDQWAEIESNIHTLIEFPVWTDVNDTQVQSFHDALTLATGSAPRSAQWAVVYRNRDLVKFTDLVSDLRKSFDLTRQHVEHVGWDEFEDVERKTLSRAKQLLAMSLDDGASDNERLLAYRQVLKRLDGLVDLPDLAVMEYEARLGDIIPVDARTPST